MKKRIREICAVLAVAVYMPCMAVPGIAACGQPEGDDREATPSETGYEVSLKEEFSGDQEETEGTGKKGIRQEATPSETEWEFIREEPEDPPGYYRKAGNSTGLYVFTGRDGQEHWRIYGRMNEDELSGWYACGEQGEIDENGEIIFLEEEYMTLAPYIYRHVQPDKAALEELEKQIGEGFSYKKEEAAGENPDGSFYDFWKIAFTEEEEPQYWFYGYIDNTEGEENSRASWLSCDENGRMTQIKPRLMMARALRAWSPAALKITREGNTVTIYYRDSLGRENYDNSNSNYTFAIGILLNNVSLAGDSRAGFYPETSTVENNVVKREYNGICKGLSWRSTDEDGVFTCEKTEPTVTVTGGVGSVKLADKITGTKREWYEDYERESTGFSAIPQIECTLVLTNPSPLITGVGYGIRYTAADGEGGDNNVVKACVGNVDISSECKAAHVHEGLTRKEPDCTNPGSISGTCTFCKMEVNETIPPLGHQSPAEYDTVSVPGYKIKNCTRCGARLETVANLYYVEYHGNGNTGGATGKTTHYIDQTSALASNGFSRTGWSFAGWNTKADGSGTAYKEGQNIKNLTLTGNETIHLYAQWSVNSYTVTFHGNGGSDGRSITKTYDSPLGSLPSSTRLGYGFTGWWSAASGGQQITEDTRIPAGNMDVYAQWKPNTYQIHFEGNGEESGSMEDQTFSYDEEKGLAGNRFAKTGYRFAGWDDGNGTVYRDGEKIRNLTSENGKVITLTARWLPITYMIAWHGGAGYTDGQMPVQVLTYDKEETLAKNQFQKTGYSFAGWSLQENGEGERLTDGQKVMNLAQTQDETIHLYAQWENTKYKITFSPNSGTCQVKEKEVFYDKAVGELPVPVKEDYRFLGWFHEKSGSRVTEESIYKDLEDIRLIANWELQFENLGNGTNRRPGPDGSYDTEDDKYYTNGLDGEAGTDDDRRIYPGSDGTYGTADDFYIGSSGEKIFSGMDQAFGTEDDYRLYSSDKNERPGPDGIFDTDDDELWWNGRDKLPGNDDDRKIYPGEDGTLGTSDDYYEDKDEKGNEVKIHAGKDRIFGTEDDYIAGEDGTHTRPGEDSLFGTDDDEKWWNGEDQMPGTEDDTPIYPGADGEYGTEDDYIDRDKEDGTHTRPGEDGSFGTEDDEKWWNGEDGVPGTGDDKEIHPGEDGEYGTEDDYVDNGDGTHTRPGEDGSFGTDDDEKWWNGEDEVPGTGDDKEIHPGEDGEYGTEDDYVDNGDGTHTRPGEDGVFGTDDDEIWENGEDGVPGTGDDIRKDEETGEITENSNHSSSGSSGGSGGGGSSSSGSSASVSQEGTWVLDHIGWWYRYPDGTWPKDGWFQLSYQGKTEWYHFDANGYMQTGWFTDKDGKIYFLHNVSDGTMGRMYTDWNLIDGKWYYFNPVSDGFKGALMADMQKQ